MRLIYVLVLVGCGPAIVKLDRKRVKSISAEIAGGGTSVCVRDDAPQLVARVTYSDGKTLQSATPRVRAGTFQPSELAWTTELGSIDVNARLHVPRLEAWYDRPLAIDVAVPGRPEMHDRLALMPRFDCAGGTDHDGIAGRAPRRIQVSLAYVETTLNGKLVLVRVAESGLDTEYHLVDRKGPGAATFTVSVRGAPGRDGASGSSGSNGSTGSSGSDGSSGGTCEDGGNGSDGGAVELVYPAAFPELASAIEIVVAGGAGGRAGEGGSAGSGGSGGSGGHGGSGGSTTRSDGSYCSTSSGHDGGRGRDGRSGSAGRDGQPGHDGQPGSITAHAGESAEVFGNEIARGWRVLTN